MSNPEAVLRAALEVESAWMERHATKEQRVEWREREIARDILAAINAEGILEEIRNLPPDADAPDALVEAIFYRVRDIRVFHERCGTTVPELEEAGLAMARFVMAPVSSEAEIRKFLKLPSEESEVNVT